MSVSARGSAVSSTVSDAHYSTASAPPTTTYSSMFPSAGLLSRCEPPPPSSSSKALIAQLKQEMARGAHLRLSENEQLQNIIALVKNTDISSASAPVFPPVGTSSSSATDAGGTTSTIATNSPPRHAFPPGLEKPQIKRTKRKNHSFRQITQRALVHMIMDPNYSSQKVESIKMLLDALKDDTDSSGPEEEEALSEEEDSTTSCTMALGGGGNDGRGGDGHGGPGSLGDRSLEGGAGGSGGNLVGLNKSSAKSGGTAANGGRSSGRGQERSAKSVSEASQERRSAVLDRENLPPFLRRNSAQHQVHQQRTEIDPAEMKMRDYLVDYNWRSIFQSREQDLHYAAHRVSQDLHSSNQTLVTTTPESKPSFPYDHVTKAASSSEAEYQSKNIAPDRKVTLDTNKKRRFTGCSESTRGSSSETVALSAGHTSTISYTPHATTISSVPGQDVYEPFDYNRVDVVGGPQTYLAPQSWQTFAIPVDVDLSSVPGEQSSSGWYYYPYLPGYPNRLHWGTMTTTGTDTTENR